MRSITDWLDDSWAAIVKGAQPSSKFPKLSDVLMQQVGSKLTGGLSLLTAADVASLKLAAAPVSNLLANSWREVYLGIGAPDCPHGLPCIQSSCHPSIAN